jgi:hypothetical protein
MKALLVLALTTVADYDADRKAYNQPVFFHTRQGETFEVLQADFTAAALACHVELSQSIGPKFWNCLLDELKRGALAELSEDGLEFMKNDYKNTLDNSRALLMQLRNFTCSMDDEGSPIIETKVG